ncbi:hypothetical protein GCM10010302_24250 [Streptomyces polychromogenes]|uniref:Uncharacterized protein n=1 Tax=Streptomyces polychromogenes TaxID=67342 RepID=A0ABN0VBM0_9ACTN
MARPGVPAIGSVDELMELLHARHAGPDAPGRDLGLRTAALLRRSHPYDKELQVAGLLHGLTEGPGLPGTEAAGALRALLGDRVAGLLAGGAGAADAEALHQAAQAGRAPGLDAGVVEDWRPVLELVAAGAYQL